MIAWMNEMIGSLLDRALSMLPPSPFSQYIDGLANLPYLSYLNWFIPIGTFIKIGATWLTAILCFYIASIFLRWVKAIE